MIHPCIILTVILCTISFAIREGAIRAKLPEDYQIVIAIFSSYVGLFFVSKLFSGGGSPAAAAPAPKASSGGSIPSFADDNWASWAEQGDNLARWEKSLE